MRTIEYQHDVLGQVTSRVDRAANGEVATRVYTYDALDRLASETVTQPHEPVRHCAYSYDDVGRRTAKYSSEFDVLYTQGEGDRLAGWQVSATHAPTCWVEGGASEPIGLDPRYGTNEVSGGVAGVVPAVAGSNFSARVALAGLGPRQVIAASSDAAGNVGWATNSFTLGAYTTGAYACDAAGCVTNIAYASALSASSARTLSWDAEYRLTSVTTNATLAEAYGYDPLGRRVSTKNYEPGTTNSVFHLYDASWHTLADMDAGGSVIRSYVYGPGVDELLAMTVHQGAAAGTYTAIRDHQNTVWGWVDEGGSVVESYDYDAWGRVLAVRGADGLVLDRSALGNRFLFQGREYAYATGLYQFRMRWYDPVTGRWLSNDPIGISGGWNQYVFCGDNPVNLVDPLGLVAWGKFWRGTAGLAANVVGAAVGYAGSATGAGAVLAVWCSANAGVQLGNIVNALRDDTSPAPAGAVGAATELAQIAVGSNNNVVRTVANITDMAGPMIVSGQIDWSRVPSSSMNLFGLPSDAFTRAAADPTVVMPWLNTFQAADAGLIIWDSGSSIYNELTGPHPYDNDNCK